MASHTYTTGGRAFDIMLTATQASSSDPTSWAWTVEHVFESGEEITVPRIENVVASAEDAAYARACDRIDKWLHGSAA